MIRMILLGSGNVAQHLYAAFSLTAEVKIIQCYNRKGVLLHPEQKKNEITDQLQNLLDADVYIAAVSDDAIASVSEKLPFHNRLVVHVSGSAPMNTISNHNRSGVFYPLQTFSKVKSMEYSEIPFCVEAENEKDKELLRKIAYSVSKRVYDISSEQRGKLHIAAVFVNNFTNYLYMVGKDICDENDIPFEILHPLIEETSKKIVTTTPEYVQTGPAIRGDIQTIERHLSSLEKESQKNIYNLLTKAIQTHYGKKL